MTSRTSVFTTFSFLLYLTLSSLQCFGSLAVHHLHRRAHFSLWNSDEGGCFYEQYQNANETESQTCNICSLGKCHEQDRREFGSVKSSATKNEQDALGGDFNVVKVETEQALLEDESNGLKRHLFIAFHIQCQNASTVQTFISIDIVKKKTKKVAVFCHQVTHSCTSSYQFKTYLYFSEILEPYDMYTLDMLFYSDSAAEIRSGERSFTTTNRALVQHMTIALAQPPISAPVDGPVLGSTSGCNQLMMSSHKGYAQWQMYAVVATVFLFLAFLAALAMFALHKNHFHTFLKSIRHPQSQKPTVRLKKFEDNDCCVLIETDEENCGDWAEDEVFVATRNRASSLTKN